jgi:hypothetical protein
MTYNTGVMRFLRRVCALGAWSWLVAQTPEPSAAVDRARRLMEDAGKLADLRTGKAIMAKPHRSWLIARWF